MGDFLTVTTGVWHIGASAWRFVQALGTFNYQLITSLFKFLTNGWSAVCVICASFGNTFVEIVTYVLEIVIEFGRFFNVCLQFLYKLTIFALNILLVFYGILEQAAIEVAHMLTAMLRWIFAVCANRMDELGISVQTVRQAIDGIYSYCYNSLSNFLQYIQTCINSFNSSTIEYLTLLYDYVYLTIEQVSVLIFRYLQHAIHNLDKGLVYCCCCVWNTLTIHIPNGVYQLRETIATSNDVSITIVLTSIAVMLFLRFMRKKGLTLPFVHPSYYPSGLVNVVLDQTDPFDAQIVVSDDEDIGDDDLYDADSGDSSDEGTSTTTGSTRSSHISGHTGHDSSDSDISSVVEYEVMDDSEFEADEAADENDQNAINIQLPERNRSYALRSRVTPSPARSLNKFNERDLERYFEKERDKRSCVVCQDQVKNVLVLPCKHMCMCVDCAHAIASSTNPTRRVCPLCRGHIDTVMSVYL